MPIQIPNLKTLHSRPSWTNHRNRTDRSACIDIRASTLRKLLDPPFQPAHSPQGRTHTATVTLTKPLLLHILSQTHPRQLAGDFRSGKANAMRPQSWGPPRTDRTGRRRLPNINTINQPNRPDHLPTHNPNKGWTHEKILALPNNFTQPVRIELYRNNLNKLTPLLICPHAPRPANPTYLTNEPSHDPRFPPLSTRTSQGHTPTGHCPQRVQRLFLPLATQAEYQDAQTAHTFLNSLPPHITARNAHLLAPLYQRYQTLFPTRTLQCRRCVGLRYGNNPNTQRKRSKQG